MKPKEGMIRLLGMAIFDRLHQQIKQAPILKKQLIQKIEKLEGQQNTLIEHLLTINGEMAVKKIESKLEEIKGQIEIYQKQISSLNVNIDTKKLEK